MATRTHEQLSHPNAVTSDGTCIACQLPTVNARCEHCGAAQRAGEFRVLRVLSKTAHGRTYLAVDRDNQRVALRELIFSMVPDAEQLEAFEREAKLLRGLKHPQIPRFVASFQEGSGAGLRLYLAQEHVEGTPLLATLEDHRYNEREVRDLGVQLLTILEYLHGLAPPVIHGELNPSNVLVRPDGKLALVGFAAARELERVNVPAGTAGFGYHAPEQLTGAALPASDLYGVGVILLHLLTRRPPEELTEPGQPFKVRERLSGSETMTATVERLVAPNPTDRFASATEARRALETGKLKKRVSRRMIATTWAAVALLAGGLGLGTYQLLSGPEQVTAGAASADVQPLFAELRAQGRSDLADQLEGRVTKAVEALRASGRKGYVLVGQVVLQGGKSAPEDTFTQTEVLEDGYFVATAADLRRPISFRIHGYEPTVLRPTTWSNVEVQNIGEVRLKPVAASLLGQVTADVAVEDPTRGPATVKVFMQGGSVNSLDDRRDAGEKLVVEQRLPPGGELTLGGFSPVQYRLELGAPGHETVSITRDFDRGSKLELGPVKLPRLRTVTVDYRVLDSGLSGSVTSEGRPLELGLGIDGGAIGFQQQNGEVRFVTAGAPASVTDLGRGSLEELAGREPTEGARAPEDVILQPGHAYLIDLGARGKVVAAPTLR